MDVSFGRIGRLMLYFPRIEQQMDNYATLQILLFQYHAKKPSLADHCTRQLEYQVNSVHHLLEVMDFELSIVFYQGHRYHIFQCATH